MRPSNKNWTGLVDFLEKDFFDNLWISLTNNRFRRKRGQ